MAAKSKLTLKQTKFVSFYLANGLNATKAAKSAGYSAKTAASIGEENLRKPEIARAIAAKTQKHLTKLDISAERTLNEIGRVAFFDPLKLFEDDGSVKRLQDIDSDTRACIAGFEVTEIFGGDGEQKHAFGLVKKLKLADKLTALDKLARYHSLYKDKEDESRPVTVVMNLRQPR